MESRVIFDSGVGIVSPNEIYEINDQPSTGYVTPQDGISRTPRTAHAISFGINKTVATNKILEKFGARLNIADGAKRPGTK